MFNIKSKISDTLDTRGHIGNTSNMCHKRLRQRARSWCFTWNNYSKDNIDTLTHTFSVFGNNKYIFQEEIGKNGTRHLQGVVNFKNAISFFSLKKISSEIHWEKCKNLKASIKYCSKEETRSGKLYQSGIEINELWAKPIVITHQDRLKHMEKEMMKTCSEVAEEWAKLEIERYGTQKQS